jgi:hypothetical protein
MKYIAFTVLGLVLLAAICGVVLWTNMPTAKLTVQPVGPMGTNICLDGAPRRPCWPVWNFAVTNAGRSPAQWIAYFHFKSGTNEWADLSSWNFPRQTGTLAAGKSFSLQVGIPPDSGTNWALTIKYWPKTSSVENTLAGWFKPFPMLRNILPNSADHFAASAWHQGTNITTGERIAAPAFHRTANSF